MKSWIVAVFVVALGACFVAANGWAQSSGDVSIALSKQLYCSTKTFFEGNIGLLIGLLMLVAGFWALINGGKIVGAMVMIVVGSLVTALPSLIEASFGGLSALLNQTQISDSAYNPPKCSATTTPTSGTGGMTGSEYTSLKPPPKPVGADTLIPSTAPANINPTQGGAGTAPTGN
jgi:hypothetical protein